MATSGTRKPGGNKSVIADIRRDGYTPTYGCYLATVTGHVEGSRMGELMVTIPEWNTPGSESVDLKVGYASPFYGKTFDTDTGNPTSGNSPMTSGQSYGMWMVPPDIGNKVLVMFVNGDQNRDGYWFACVYDSPSHHMVPAIGRNVGGTKADALPSGGIAAYLSSTSKLPVVEFDTALSDPDGDLISTPRYPHEYQTMRLVMQGLDTDTIRGAISSSSLRESPSNVYGISTPGRKVTAADQVASKPEVVYARKGGHSFVMDDGDANGNDQLIRLRTTNGHQILMNDTNDVLYISSASGNQWLEFSQNGQINVYGIGGFNMRTKGPMNFHSESSITMEAKLGIKMQAGISMGFSTAGTMSLGALGSMSIGALGKTSISAGAQMTIASGAALDIGAIGLVKVDGSLLMLNSGKPPVPIPPIPPIPKAHVDTAFNGHNWLPTDFITSLCTDVPAHEPWTRPKTDPSTTNIGEPTATTATTATATTAATTPVAKPLVVPVSKSTTTQPSTSTTGGTVPSLATGTVISTSSGSTTTVNGPGSGPPGGTSTGTNTTGTNTTGNNPTTLVYPTQITSATISPANGVTNNTTGFTYTFTFDKPAAVAFTIPAPSIGFQAAGSSTYGTSNPLSAIPIAAGAKGFTYFVDTSNYGSPGSVQVIFQGYTAQTISTSGGNGGNGLTLAAGVTIPKYTVLASSTSIVNTTINPIYPSSFTVVIDKTTEVLGSASGFTYTFTLNKPAVSAFTVVLSPYFQPSAGSITQLTTVSILVPAAATTFTYKFDLTKMINAGTGAAVAASVGSIYLQNLKAGLMVVSNSDGLTSTPAANGGNNLSGVTQLPVYTLTSIAYDPLIVDLNINGTYQYVISRTDNASPTPHITTTTLPEVIFTTGGTSSQTVNGTTYTFVYGSGGTVTKTTGTPSKYPKTYTITIDNTTGVAGNKTGFTISVTLNIPALTTFSGLMNVAFSGKTVGTIPVTFLAGAVTSNYKFDVTKIIPQAVGGTIQIPNGIYVDNAGNGNYNLTGPDSPIYTVTPPVVVPVAPSKPNNQATITLTPNIPTQNQPYSVSIDGGYPGDTVAISGSITSSTTLDGNGHFLWPSLVWPDPSVNVTFTFAATGQVINVTRTLNAPAPVYNPAVYVNNVTTGAQHVNTVNYDDQIKVVIAGGAPGDAFTMSGDTTGSGTLDAGGNYIFDTLSINRTYSVVFTFATGINRVQTVTLTCNPQPVVIAPTVYSPTVYVNDLTNGQTGLVANASFDYGDTLQVYIAGGRPGDTFNVTGDIATNGTLGNDGGYKFDSFVLTRNYLMNITYGSVAKTQTIYLGLL